MLGFKVDPLRDSSFDVSEHVPGVRIAMRAAVRVETLQAFHA
jgi:hypothetical protein